MNIIKKIYSSCAFTLVELVVAITILMFIMVSVFTIYSNLINVYQKLEQTRILEENTRMITETLATDIRENWIDFSGCNVSIIPGECLITSLRTKDGNEYYIATKDPVSGVFQSLSWSFVVANFPTSANPVSITWEGVIIKNLFFSLSWTGWTSTMTNNDKEWKVQMVFEIGLAPKWNISVQSVQNSFITIQTTISEKIYKSN